MRAGRSDAGGRIARAFGAARAQRRCALIPYVAAGDPDPGRTPSIVRALARGGADIVEIGVPFSDPIADGPVNQRAAERALRNGVTLGTCLDLARDLRAGGAPPIVLFTYYNPVHRMGPAAFAKAAAASGVDGVLVTDLPPEEAGDLRGALSDARVDLIFLLSPTSSRERVERVCGAASGFVYFVSRTGVTGVREELPRELEAQVRSARGACTLPIAVGFGVGRPEQARAIAGFADGVVVGSALVRIVEEQGASPGLEAALETLCNALSGALRG